LLKTISKYLIIFIIFANTVVNSNAQETIFGGINIGVKAGGSLLITEFSTDLSQSINEFDNKSGLSVAVELSKYLSDHWEIALEINQVVLNGENYSPSFSADGYHAVFMNPLTGPVEYNNTLLGQKIVFGYFIKSLCKHEGSFNINPFIRAGVGLQTYKSKFKYIDAADDIIIFGKGENNNYTDLSTAVYTFGTGFKTNLSPKFYLITSFTLNLVSYDFLDVVHNYDNTGNRLNLSGVYTDINVGIFYTITNYKPGKGRNKKSSIREYLPFGK